MSNTLDSDDEFGYDLSIEDEQALFQLSSDRLDTSDPSVTIDSVPSRTHTISSGASTAPGNTHYVQSQGYHDAATFPSDPIRLLQAGACASPVSLDENVTYPDCTSFARDCGILSYAPTD